MLRIAFLASLLVLPALAEEGNDDSPSPLKTYGRAFGDPEKGAAGQAVQNMNLMLGLPGESHASMLAGASRLSALPIRALKLHQLQLVHGRTSS